MRPVGLGRNGHSEAYTGRVEMGLGVPPHPASRPKRAPQHRLTIPLVSPCVMDRAVEKVVVTWSA